MSTLTRKLASVVEQKGHLRLEDPVQLASGDYSRHFLDGKRALARGQDLRLAVETVFERVDEARVSFDAVGGLTMGADHLAHGVALMRDGVEWFSVRKVAKDRGTRRRIEGAQLGPGRRVLLVEDVVTRGGSILSAFEAVTEAGAEVVGALALLDRGGPEAARFFSERGIPYLPLLTHEELDIPAVGTEAGVSDATR